MRTLIVVLVALAAVCLADEFSFGGMKQAKAGYVAVDQTRKKGHFMSKKSVKVGSTTFKNPTYLVHNIGGSPTPCFRVQIGKKVFYYPLSGANAGMWLIYKT